MHGAEPIPLPPRPAPGPDAHGLDAGAAGVQDLARFTLPPGFRGRSAVAVQLWWLVQATLFGLSPQAAFGWRRWLLRRFGAQIGARARIRPSVRCVYPWRLKVGAYAWIGDGVTLYSLDRIRIGPHAVVSHAAFLCTGTHDPDDPAFALRTAPVRVGPEAWIAAGAFVAPGVTVGRGAVVGMRALVLHDVPAMMVAAGHPARALRRRGAAAGRTTGW